MSGRGGRGFYRGGGKFGSKPFYDSRGHDDRVIKFTSDRSKTIRRVQRLPNRADNDVPMEGDLGTRGRGGYRGRGVFRGKGRRQRGGWDGGHRKSEIVHTFGPGWHKVLVTNGSSLDRDFVLNTIASMCRPSFQPIAYSVWGVNAVFFVEGQAVAEAVSACSGQFSGPDSQPIYLKVDTYGAPPTAAMDEKIEARLKTTLQKRYDPAGPSLLLQDFPHSPDLVTDYYVPLFRPSVVTKIFTILCDVLTPLVILDISDNKLTTLEPFQKLPQLTPNLRALNVSENKLREIHFLERIRGLPLLEINLQKNPFTQKYTNREEYLRVVRKFFPKIIKLDGQESPPPVTFELDEHSDFIPSILPGVSCNADAKKIVMTFVQQYFKIYDEDSREPLLQAYHDSAVLTIQSSYIKPGHPGGEPANSKLNAYISESRNFKRNQDPIRLDRCFHRGKLDVVAFLARLPKTTHDTNGFTVDLTLALPTMIHFVVTGCFKERGQPLDMYLRYFHRSYVLVPQNQGYVITNEMVFVTNASIEQSRAAFKLPTPTPTPSPNLSGPSRVVTFEGELPNIPSLSLVTDAEKKRLMVIQFAKESTMNEAYAERCLEQNEWDYTKSAMIFTEMHRRGEIPAEAFTK